MRKAVYKKSEKKPDLKQSNKTITYELYPWVTQHSVHLHMHKRTTHQLKPLLLLLYTFQSCPYSIV